MTRLTGLLGALSIALASPAAANPLLSQVHDIWSAGASDLAGYTLPEPTDSAPSVTFDCGKCEDPFLALIQQDPHSDPDAVIAQMSECGEVTCILREFAFEGLRAVEHSYVVLETETITTRYFREDGGDLILVVLRLDDGTDGDFPLIRAFEAAYIRPLLTQAEAN